VAGTSNYQYVDQISYGPGSVVVLSTADFTRLAALGIVK
jgi:hypothetical protein